MENIRLRKATSNDKAIVVDFDYRLDKDEHIKFNREEKITKAIMDDECFMATSKNPLLLIFAISNFLF